MAGEKYHDLNQTKFHWAVSKTGYQWIPSEKAKGVEEQTLFLLPKPGPDGSIGTGLWSKIYEPLEDDDAGFRVIGTKARGDFDHALDIAKKIGAPVICKEQWAELTEKEGKSE